MLSAGRDFKREILVQYYEQAQIPEVLFHRDKNERVVVTCPLCHRKTIGFKDQRQRNVWSAWCVCGWNVDEARRCLRRCWP